MNSDPVPSLGSYPRGGAQRFPVYLPASNQQAVRCLRAESRLRTSLCGRARSFVPRWRRGRRRCQPAAVRKGGGIPSSGKSGTKPIRGKGLGARPRSPTPLPVGGRAPTKLPPPPPGALPALGLGACELPTRPPPAEELR